MIVSIALSLFFGIVAALALSVCAHSGRQALAQARAIRAELAAMDRAERTAQRRRRPVAAMRQRAGLS